MWALELSLPLPLAPLPANPSCCQKVTLFLVEKCPQMSESAKGTEMCLLPAQAQPLLLPALRINPRPGQYSASVLCTPIEDMVSRPALNSRFSCLSFPSVQSQFLKAYRETVGAKVQRPPCLGTGFHSECWLQDSF